MKEEEKLGDEEEESQCQIWILQLYSQMYLQNEISLNIIHI